ncbi:MAG: hypothetical protein IMZ61_07150 [Planctomycetes bacterium]|nr:hypothetical protein [Planctomycetota bacterium]
MTDQIEQTKTAQNFPIRFVGTVMDNGYDALHEYLKANEAPEAIIELAEGLDLLSQFMEARARNRKIIEPDEGTADGLMQVTSALDRLGFGFQSSRGIA